MGHLKPWQAVLMIVAIVVLAVSLWINLLGGDVPNPGSITVADVETGELFYIDTSGRKVALLPATNPNSGERTLFPVRKDDDGTWKITRMGMGALGSYEGPAAALADRGSGIVTVSDDKPRALD